MNEIKKFDFFLRLGFIIFCFVIIFVIMFKAFKPSDLIDNYNFLSSFVLKDRFFRGIDFIEFYKIEMEIGGFTKALILDCFNVIVFVPFGMFLSHFFKRKKLMYVFIISFCFSLVIELFQLFSIIGAFMINDLICNVIGGIIGVFIYSFLIKKERYRLYNNFLLIFVFVFSFFGIFLFVNVICNLDIYKGILNI